MDDEWVMGAGCWMAEAWRNNVRIILQDPGSWLHVARCTRSILFSFPPPVERSIPFRKGVVPITREDRPHPPRTDRENESIESNQKGYTVAQGRTLVFRFFVRRSQSFGWLRHSTAGRFRCHHLDHGDDRFAGHDKSVFYRYVLFSSIFILHRVGF